VNHQCLARKQASNLEFGQDLLCSIVKMMYKRKKSKEVYLTEIIHFSKSTFTSKTRSHTLAEK
jgi:hypothetical protein